MWNGKVEEAPEDIMFFEVNDFFQTNQEKADLIAFLKTLTDDTFTNSGRLSSPF